MKYGIGDIPAPESDAEEKFLWALEQRRKAADRILTKDDQPKMMRGNIQAGAIEKPDDAE